MDDYIKQNLDKARKNKNDEFYTRKCDVSSEVGNYKEFFSGKIVYCPCDGASGERVSAFYDYFRESFDDFGLKKLICTKYFPEGNGIRWDFDGKILSEKRLDGNGSFDSPECVEIMNGCDIVVTNPPFSLFRPFISQIMKTGKKCLVIGNSNAITYKEIFPLLQNNQLWLGITRPKVFEVPISEIENPKTQFESDGKFYQRFGNICWFTNLMHGSRSGGLNMPGKYCGNEDKYPVYDNCNAIEIGHLTKNGKWEGSLDELPDDYFGLMGVPITFLDNYNPEQFEIVRFRKGDDGKDLTFNGYSPYFRILIKRKTRH